MKMRWILVTYEDIFKAQMLNVSKDFAMQTGPFAVIPSVLGFECVRKLTEDMGTNKTVTE